MPNCIICTVKTVNAQVLIVFSYFSSRQSREFASFGWLLFLHTRLDKIADACDDLRIISCL